ncbi:DASS family sodium-coupled anion symporter [Desulfosporosinus sp.]|uniref:DASS family sodium-coupled anion symporter n=1 Tax=Desulfosporosinus sp. TaxID=157907 RepID=UPI0025C37C45|nr:DASS family sodium-coupled anion symporter [Desulfosporosinus sp.]MBC2723357.1 DASS family sodium-coupled anion symporter [Desulfosporosinus sp.]MBC2727997.1 DASS family sodium-coupled anion symporter [Desulfosporosinus sp.]
MSQTIKIPITQGLLSGRTLKIFIPILFAALFFVVQAPKGLEVEAWKLFGIFAGTILMLMLQGLPEASAIFVGVSAAGLLVVPIKDVLVGYTDTTVWLIVVAIMMSLGFRKSGLAKRIGLILIKAFGKSSLGLGYVLGVTDLMLATTIPGAPARVGGLVYPLAQGIFEVVGSKPHENPRRLGAYLTVLLYMMDMVAGSLFLTGMGPNLLSMKFASQILGVKVSWGLWIVAAVPGFLLFILVPYIVYKMYPPELTLVNEVREMAREQLKTLGSITKREIIGGVTFLLCLILWATSSITQIDTTLVAFLGVTIMILTDVIQWKDIADSKETWGILIWFGGIIGLSSALDKLGFFRWLTVVMKDALPQGIGTFTTFVIIALLAIIPHYVFPSLLGYVATFAPVIYSFVAVTGAPKYPATFLVAFLMVISSTLTHYGNGLGPLLMGTGYVEKITWWKIGFTVTALATIVYLTIGLAYWKIIGLW